MLFQPCCTFRTDKCFKTPPKTPKYHHQNTVIKTLSPKHYLQNTIFTNHQQNREMEASGGRKGKHLKMENLYLEDGGSLHLQFRWGLVLLFAGSLHPITWPNQSVVPRNRRSAWADQVANWVLKHMLGVLCISETENLGTIFWTFLWKQQRINLTCFPQKDIFFSPENLVLLSYHLLSQLETTERGLIFNKL